MTDIVMKELPLDPRGHLFRHGETVKVLYGTSEEPYMLGLFQDCGMCGQLLDEEIAEDKVQIKTFCPYPDGITSANTVDFPSGKIVVTDDLRPVFNGFSDDFASYNTAYGQHQVIEAYAALGCAYGPVGNSCPGLYRTGEGTYVIASLALDENDEKIIPQGWEYLTGIVTDLWAYSIADYDRWVSRGGDPGSLGWADSVIEFPPGSYQFTHHTGEKGFDGFADGLIVYAEIEKI